MLYAMWAHRNDMMGQCENKIQIHDRPSAGPMECAYLAMVEYAPLVLTMPVYQMRLLDGSLEQFRWAEVTEEEFNTELKNPDEWEKRVLYTTK
jgi:hypothetical protein